MSGAVGSGVVVTVVVAPLNHLLVSLPHTDSGTPETELLTVDHSEEQNHYSNDCLYLMTVL